MTAEAPRRWVYCRGCLHFRPYRTVWKAGLGYCGANPRRHDVDKDQKRRCPDFEATAGP